MNREQTKKCIEVMQAFVDGCMILYADNMKTDHPCWNWNEDPLCYRIGPKYRPFTFHDIALFLGKTIKSKTVYKEFYTIQSAFKDSVGVCGGNITYSGLLEAWTFEDGSPCGVKEE